MGKSVDNIKKSASNISNGKNVLQSGMSLATYGLMGAGEDQANAATFEDRLKGLEASGVFGGMSFADYQKQNQSRNTAGFGYATSAANNAQQVLDGQVPSLAQIQFNQGLDKSIAGASSMAQSAPVDSALAYRSAMDAYNNHMAESTRNAAMLRAQEISQARGDLANIGGNLQGIYSGNMNNAMGTFTGVQGTALSNQQTIDAARYQAQQNQANALIGAAGSVMGGGILSGIGGAAAGAIAPKGSQKGAMIDAGLPGTTGRTA